MRHNYGTRRPHRGKVKQYVGAGGIGDIFSYRWGKISETIPQEHKSLRNALRSNDATLRRLGLIRLNLQQEREKNGTFHCLSFRFFAMAPLLYRYISREKRNHNM